MSSDTDVEDLLFDCNEELFRDIDIDLGFSDLYESIQDVEDNEDEEIANKVLTGLLEDAAATLNTSLMSHSTSSKALLSTKFSSQTVSSFPKQLSPTLSWKLDQLESLYQKYTFRIDDVQEINEINFANKWFSKLGEEPWKKGIEFAKALDGFSQLCEDDQVVLVKSYVSEYGTLANCMTADVEGKKLVFEDRKRQKILIDINLMKSMMGMDDSDLTRRHRDLFKKALASCLPEWRLNRKLMLLLCGISLFNPDRQRLRDRCLVWKIQEFFYDLLRKYLAVLYPREADARLAFVGLIGFLACIREAGKVWLKDFYFANIPFFKQWIDQYSTPFTRELFGITEC